MVSFEDPHTAVKDHRAADPGQRPALHLHGVTQIDKVSGCNGVLVGGVGEKERKTAKFAR